MKQIGRLGLKAKMSCQLKLVETFLLFFLEINQRRCTCSIKLLSRYHPEQTFLTSVDAFFFYCDLFLQAKLCHRFSAGQISRVAHELFSFINRSLILV
jgi:hypothetical protein